MTTSNRTIVVLHGGATNLATPQNDKFFSLFTSLTNKKVINIAMVYWARSRETWNDIFNRDKPRILEQKKLDKTANFLIPETPGELLQKMVTIDVVYVAGGEASNIEPLYKKLGEMKTVIKGKVYLGSSMGTFMASQNYVLSSDENDANSVHQGLGLVPVNTLCHWNVEPNKEQKLALLKNASELPITTLNEGEFVKYEL